MLIMARSNKKQDSANISLKGFEEEAYITPSRYDRTPMEGRTRFRLTIKYVVPGYTDPLPGTAELVECNDGFWAVLIQGEQMCYRLGPTIIESLKESMIPVS